MKKEAGFTLIEILAVVILLGVLLSLMYNVMIQNAFNQKKTKNEMEAQNSSKALLNHIGEVVMEQNVPIVSEIDGEMYSEDIEYSGVYQSIEFNDGTLLTKETDNTYIFDDKTYSYIKEVQIEITKNGRGLNVTVIGQSDKASTEFSSTFYTRNT